MKKKVGTILDEKLLKTAKQVAVEQNLTISQLFEEALQSYLRLLEGESKPGNVTKQTKGAMKASPELLKAVMEEENFYES